MATVGATTSSTNTSSTTSSSTTSSNSSTSSSSTVGYNSFLKLLTTQLQYQDPTNPTDATQFVSQLASFSQVEQGIKTNTKLDSLITSMALSQASDFIGRTVTSSDGSVSGKVASVNITSSGAQAVLESGKKITLDAGIQIS